MKKMEKNKLIIPKEDVISLDENMSLTEALTIFEQGEYSVLPVLDKTRQLFRGNIYLLDLYRHQAQKNDMTISLHHLLRNTTKYIMEGENFISILFKFSNLPYMAVLTKQRQFLGILTKKSFMTLFERSISFTDSKYVLTLATQAPLSDLNKAYRILQNQTTVVNFFQNKAVCAQQNSQCELVFFLGSTSEAHLAKIQKKLAHAHLNVLSCQALSAIK